MSDPGSWFWAAVRGELPAPPAAKLLGWTALEAEPGSGRIRVRFEATEAFTNPLGNVQGGFLAAMLDDTLGPACATASEAQEFGHTIELKVNFIRPAKPGTFVGEGWVVHRGRSIAFLQGELRDQAGELVATATATARIARIARDDVKL